MRRWLIVYAFERRNGLNIRQFYIARLLWLRVPEGRAEPEDAGGRAPIALLFHRAFANGVAMQAPAPSHSVASDDNRNLFADRLPLVVDRVAFIQPHLTINRVPSACGAENELTGFGHRFQ